MNLQLIECTRNSHFPSWSVVCMKQRQMNFIKLFSANFQKLDDYQLITFFLGGTLIKWKVRPIIFHVANAIMCLLERRKLCAIEWPTKYHDDWVNTSTTITMMEKMEMCALQKNRRWNLRLMMISCWQASDGPGRALDRSLWTQSTFFSHSLFNSSFKMQLINSFFYMFTRIYFSWNLEIENISSD